MASKVQYFEDKGRSSSSENETNEQPAKQRWLMVNTLMVKKRPVWICSRSWTWCLATKKKIGKFALQKSWWYETENYHTNYRIVPTRDFPWNLNNFINEKYADGITKPNAILDLIWKKEMVDLQTQNLSRFCRHFIAKRVQFLN